MTTSPPTPPVPVRVLGRGRPRAARPARAPGRPLEGGVLHRARPSSTSTSPPSVARHLALRRHRGGGPRARRLRHRRRSAPYSVIVLRDDDEEVRALHNVCRHRGARHPRRAAAARSATSCAATTAGPTPPTAACCTPATSRAGFDKGCFGLKQVHVRVVAGLVFVCLAARAARRLRRRARHASRRTSRRTQLAPHQGRRPGRPGRGGELEAGDGEQPGVLPLRGRAPRADPHLLPDLRLPAGPDPGRGCSPPTTATCRRRRRSQLACDQRAAARTRRRGSRRPGRRRSGCSARRWTARGSRTRWTAAPRPAGCSATSTRRGSAGCRCTPSRTPGATPRRPRRDLRGAAAGGRPDAGAHDLAGPRGRRRGHRLRPRHARPTCGARPTSRTRLLRTRPAGRRRPGYEPGPYAPSEYQVDAFVTWYVDRMREHVAR